MRVERVVLKHHRDVAILRRDIVHHAIADANDAVADFLQARDHAQRGAFAAAGRADEYTNLSGAERKAEIGEHIVPFAGRVGERLACDIDLKLHGGATSIAGFRMAGSGRFQ